MGEFVFIIKMSGALPGDAHANLMKLLKNGVEAGYWENPSIRVEDSAIGGDDVESIYRAYPAKCPNCFRSTGKGKKDKKKIARILSTRSCSFILDRIKEYRNECESHGTWMQNFSKFLNNLPEQTQQRTLSNIYD